MRFIVWAGISSLLAQFTAHNFWSLLSQDLNDNFGSLMPAIPFGALLTLLFALRWKDLHEILRKETGFPRKEAYFRILGLCIILFLILLRTITETWVVSESVALVATFYAMCLIVIPLTRRMMLPYALIYSLGIVAPSILEWSLGGTLATVSATLSAKMVFLSGLHVVWQGSQFMFVSKAGGVISGTVTAGCSSIISITTFLGLLALMHLDMRKNTTSTLMIAIVGVGSLIALNVFRITGLIWIGYISGANALWSIHNWLGYAIFVGFYFVTLIVYSRIGPSTHSNYSTS